MFLFFFFFSSRRRHTRCYRDWSSDVCSSDLLDGTGGLMANASPPLLEALDVSYTYSGQTPTLALEGLNLEVQDNEFVAVLGPVGCGKTTLLRIFAGFLRPTKGSVRCDGSSVDGPSPQRGYV